MTLSPALRRELLSRYRHLPLRIRAYAALRARMLSASALSEYFPRTGRVVDVGCGYGVIANYLALAGPGRDVVGIDSDSKRIHYARQTARASSRVTFAVGDAATSLPECDALLMSDFLHHLRPPDQDALLATAFRRLRPGGRLVIMEVDAQADQRWKLWLSWLSDEVLYPFQEKQHFRSPDDLSRTLGGIGFRVARVERPSALFAGIGYLCDVPA